MQPKEGIQVRVGEKGLRTGKLKLGRLNDVRKLRSVSGGGAPLVADDVGVHFRRPLNIIAETIWRLADENDSKHPFKVVSTSETTVKVCAGNVFWPGGKSDPIVYDPLAVVETGDIGVAGAGEIWMELAATHAQQSYSEYEYSSGQFITWTGYKMTNLSYTDTTYESTPPTAGTDAQDEFTTGTAIHIKIADVSLVDGHVKIDEQYVKENIYLSGLTDGLLSNYNVP